MIRANPTGSQPVAIVPGDDVRIQLDLRIPVRDGIRLYAVLYRPARGERTPVLLLRGPASRSGAQNVDWAIRFARHGYAVVIQDLRGRQESEGVWRPYVDDAQDGYDTQQWIGAQPWCDGNIGTFGVSHAGFMQILPAPLRSPYVKALVPIANQEDNYGHLRNDGVLQIEVAMIFFGLANRTDQNALRARIDWEQVYRRLPLVSALDDMADRPFYREILRHSSFDEFWKSYSMKGKYAEVEVPAYFITGWYDNLLHEMFKCFAGWKGQARSPEARGKSRLLIGPWPHGQIGGAEPFGDVDFGPEAAVDIPGLHLRWYDQRLKGMDTGIDEEPPVRLFVMGGNFWRDEQEWPLARTRYTRFYLHSRGRANALEGDGALSLEPPGDESPDVFTYDPEDPVPTLGGQSLFMDKTGPKDRRPVERREDVLVYTTSPLADDLEVTGPILLTLYAASSAPDTDFTGTLVDVHPDGKAIILCEGILRARFRESHEKPTLIQPGSIYEYRISLWETSNLFKKGHCIRVEVSSSNFPRFDRNLNTGADPGLGVEARTARQTVYHNTQHPSHVLLPVIPG